MIEELTFLRKVVEALDRHEIPYMMTGSLASIIYGEKRSTMDADIVIEPERASLRAFVEDVSEWAYVSPEAANDAFKRRGIFNIMDYETGDKTDLIIKKRRPFSDSEFERRRAFSYPGWQVSIVSPEDCILSKLEWAKAGESERQLRDVASVIRFQMKTLDWDYIGIWARELGVEAQLAEARALAGHPA